jgi:hypothetical protein
LATSTICFLVPHAGQRLAAAIGLGLAVWTSLHVSGSAPKKTEKQALALPHHIQKPTAETKKARSARVAGMLQEKNQC